MILAEVIQSRPAIPAKSEPRVEIVQSLRGLASLGVAWFHFTNGNPNFLPAGWLKATGPYTALGLEVFFVISGFVLPYSLFRAGYTASPHNYFRFLWKRISRLDPPYVASMALVILLGYVSLAMPGFRGTAPAYSAAQILLHFGYLNAFFQEPWLNPVYWSLAIEFQYYLLIGLAFPLIRSPRSLVRWFFFATLATSALIIPNGALVFHYFFLFMLGFAAFLSRATIGNRWGLSVLGALAFAGCVGTLGLRVAVVGAAASVLISIVNARGRLLAFFGDVSYSLYLVHVPVGGRVINLGERFAHNWPERIAVLALAFLISLSAAWLLYRFVEQPCRRYAGSIRFRES